MINNIAIVLLSVSAGIAVMIVVDVYRRFVCLTIDILVKARVLGLRIGYVELKKVC